MHGSDTGFRYSFQLAAAAVFKVARPSMSVANYIRVKDAGTIVLRPKLPATGYATETFVVQAGHVITGAFIELVSASPACFPIDVAGD